MNFERIVDDVRSELALAHRAEAERAVGEFLVVLGQLLDPRAEVTLASRLPLEVRAVLGPEDVEVFEVDTFIARVSDYMQLDPGVAERIVRTSARSLAAELDAEALAELVRSLPASVAALFRRAPEPHAPGP